MSPIHVRPQNMNAARNRVAKCVATRCYTGVFWRPVATDFELKTRVFKAKKQIWHITAFSAILNSD